MKATLVMAAFLSMVAHAQVQAPLRQIIASRHRSVDDCKKQTESVRLRLKELFAIESKVWCDTFKPTTGNAVVVMAVESKDFKSTQDLAFASGTSDALTTVVPVPVTRSIPVFYYDNTTVKTRYESIVDSKFFPKEFSWSMLNGCLESIEAWKKDYQFDFGWRVLFGHCEVLTTQEGEKVVAHYHKVCRRNQANQNCPLFDEPEDLN